MAKNNRKIVYDITLYENRFYRCGVLLAEYFVNDGKTDIVFTFDIGDDGKGNPTHEYAIAINKMVSDL